MVQVRRFMTLSMMLLGLSACTPLIFGAGGAVLADKVVEDQKGGDGLF